MQNPVQPALIDGPTSLVAVLTFRPNAEVRWPWTKKKGLPLPVPQENETRAAFKWALHYRGKNRGWARMLPDKYVEFWREEGQRVASEWLLLHKKTAPHLKWAKIVIVCYYPDYVRRDVHGLDEKEVIDGMADAGFFLNDAGVVQVNYGLGGVDSENPRYEFWIYEMSLTPEQEALIIKTQEKPVRKARARKVA